MLTDNWGVIGQVDYRRAFIDDPDDPEPTIQGTGDGENQFRALVGIRHTF